MFRKAQVADTITWIMATLIIIVILSFSVFAMGNLGGSKKAWEGDLTVSFGDLDFIALESFYGFLASNDFYESIQSTQEIGDAGGSLAKRIFPLLYEGEYGGDIWVGIVELSIIGFFSGGIEDEKNDFFGSRPGTSQMKFSWANIVAFGSKDFFNKWIYLDASQQQEGGKKVIELLLIR